MVVSRTENSGKPLAEKVGAIWSRFPEFPYSTDVIFVSVPDHSLETVLQNLKCGERTIVAHTAGSYGLEVFPQEIRRRAVFYPLQTFSPGRNINFREVPVLLETDDNEAAKILSGIASSISENVSFVGAERRKMLHLAAVFVCNFTNHMIAAGSDIVAAAGFDMEILHPLIKETVFKALEAGAADSQTGPAFRNDRNTIEKHLELLSSKPGFQELYRHVTQSIIEFYKPKKGDQF